MENDTLMRIAIILDKNLERGKAANVAAILMGQAALTNPAIYASVPVIDKNGNKHASIISSLWEQMRI
jgi:hypothetical protein